MKSSQHNLHERYENGDPEVGLLGHPLRKFDYDMLYSRSKNGYNFPIKSIEWDGKEESFKRDQAYKA